MSRPSNRELILDSLQELIVEGGAGNVTLDATAERAGVSKGGLLYHFPSKTDLFDALAERLAESIDAAISGAPSDPRELIAWYLSDTADNAADDNTLWRSLFGSIHAVDDDFATALRELFIRYTTALDSLPPAIAMHVRLVGDGLYLNALLGTPRPSAAHIAHIIETTSALLDAQDDRPRNPGLSS